MSKFAKFMKQNKTESKPNGFYAATKSLLDDDGKPLKWEFRHISSKEHEDIRDECMVDVPVPGKPNMYRPKFKTGMYSRKMVVHSTVFPDLYDKELLSSYGVSKPEELLLEMVDDVSEYNALVAFISDFQGFNENIGDKVEEAKN